MFNTGQIYVSENVLKIAEENEIMALLERHKKLDDDTNGEDRAVNEYAINQGFGNIINIYNIKNERVLTQEYIAEENINKKFENAEIRGVINE